MLRGMLAVMMVAAITGALGLFGTAPVAAQGSPSATRFFSPDTVAPGGQVTVTINNVANYGPSGSVTETLPQGFSYVYSSLDSERVDVDPQQVIFTLQGEASFTYTVTASDKAGPYTFSGTLRDSKENDHTVGGASTVTVTAGDPLVDRYDDNKDGTIDKSEVIAAINDYLFGTGANAITKAEVIKLINLYLFGPAAAQPPGEPTNLTATANGQTRIDLSWRVPASNGGAAITGYRVEVSTDGSSWSTLDANTNSTATRYSHTGLTAGSARRYRVSAINSAGTGPASNVAAATTDSAPGGASPDLVVQSPTVSDSSPGEGASFTLRATVRNRGSVASAPASLVYYRSTDSTISTSDTQVGTDEVGGLAASGTSNESIVLTAPSSAGTYYYGACVNPVSGEASTGNNCSDAVPVKVVERPDLVVEQPSVSNGNPDAGASFTLSATVRNRGSSSSAPTTLRYYHSTDSTITSSDTQVGRDSVGGLAASGTRNESISLNAPSSAGTYYYGACVDPVSGEASTGNNCSDAVQVKVVERPDLVVDPPTVTGNSRPDAGALFILNATVRNQGIGSSVSTTLRYFQSTDSTITSSDTQVGDSYVDGIAASESRPLSIRLTAPLEAGTYYYGACVEPVSGEASTGNNCSDAVQVEVVGRPDLVVESPSVDDPSPDTGGSFTLSVKVLNRGSSSSVLTTLRYFQSTDSTIRSSDTQVGKETVDVLAPSGGIAKSIDLTAPMNAGTYYYGACVETKIGESNTDNNCSDAVRVTVE